MFRVFTRIHFILVFALALLGASETQAQERPGRYSIYEAAGHIGEVASIRGFVAQVVTPGKGMALLCFGDYQPDQVLTAVVTDTRAFGNMKKYEGSVVEVVGKILLKRGKPEIVVNSKRQIRFIEWAAGLDMK
jgi:DNA/RNA endonuclease YhcR with UshA esterase domain